MDLSSRYLGLTLKHPVVASASPLTATLDGMKRLEDAGTAAVVMSSVYEEQIRAEDTAYALYTDHGSHSHPETSSYFPVIASLNGASAEGWVEYAARLEQAGAAALELNVWFVPTDPAQSGAEVERRYLEVVRAVRKTVRIPLAVKLSPYFSATAHMARELAAARGVEALETRLQAHGHASADAVRGVLSAERADAAAELLRSQYMRLLSEYVPSRLAL